MSAPGHIAHAKTSMPRTGDVLVRERLFKRIDEAAGVPIVWIKGPAGAGKTTLASSYVKKRKLSCLWYRMDEGDADIATFFYYLGLSVKSVSRRKKPLPLFTSEFSLGVSTFARRYFEDLFGRLRRPSIIVFDDYQQATSDSGLHDAICSGLSNIPEGVRMIVASRTDPPPAYAKMLTYGHMEIIDWGDIRFTPEESAGLFHFLGGSERCLWKVSEICEMAEGWATALVVAARTCKKDSGNMRFAEGGLTSALFDFFGKEIFETMDAGGRDLLLRTAPLTQVHEEIAIQLSGNKEAGKILTRLSGEHFFTERLDSAEKVYRYHPLFRDFILRRINLEFVPEEVCKLKDAAAGLVMKSGLPEEAARLYMESGNWQELAGIVMGRAMMLLSQGRNMTLAQWIAALPPDMVQKNPWLLYWRAAAGIYYNPASTYSDFESSFNIFKSAKDPLGAYLSWAGATESIMVALDRFDIAERWVDELSGLMQTVGEPPAEVEGVTAMAALRVCSLRRLSDPLLAFWLERGMRCPDKNIKTQVLTCAVYHWTTIGRINEAEKYIDELLDLIRPANAGGLARTIVNAQLGCFYMVKGCFEEALRTVGEGLEFSSREGIYFMDNLMRGVGLMNALFAGDYAAFDAFIGHFRERVDMLRSWEKGFYYYALAMRAYLEKDFAAAERLLSQSFDLAVRSGHLNSQNICRLLQSHLCFDLGDRRRAEELLKEIMETSMVTGSMIDPHLVHLSRAKFLRFNDKKEEALVNIRAGFETGRQHGIVATNFVWRPSDLSWLCSEALENNIETDYARRMIRAFRVEPEGAAIFNESWPWPVKVYSLGRFDIMKGEERLVFTGKVQQKPLALLKAVIALGAKDVREDNVADILWPDADGDLAHRSLDTTLHRLRRLLGSDKSLQLAEGRLTLDPLCCWSDAAAFERVADIAEAKCRLLRREEKGESGAAEEAFGLCDKAIKMYGGSFLPSETASAWTASMRERLRGKYLSLLLRCGGHLEAAGRHEEAIQFYNRGTDEDSLYEEFYQRLMVCYQGLGQEAKALKVYDRCCSTLSSVLDIMPSSKTEAILTSLRSKSSGKR